MFEVYCLSYAAAEKRGWNDGAIADAIAYRVLWLEQRGLPGMIALTREFLSNLATAPRERGLQCPIIRGALLIDQFDELVAPDPSTTRAISGPSNGILILPNVAQYAERIGAAVRVSWLIGEPPEIRAQTVVDGTSVFSVGDPSAVLLNTGVGFARHGLPIENGSSADRFETEIPEQYFGPLISFIGGERIGETHKIVAIMKKDGVTLRHLQMMSPGDRSVLEAASRYGSTDKVVMTTSPGSNNETLWDRLGSYGWTERYVDPGLQNMPLPLSQFVLTNSGRAIAPMLLGALSRFPPTMQ
jgi:hypothetical protein